MSKKITKVEEPKEIISVDTFISQAIQTGLPVETMERLFNLRKEVKAEQAKEAFTFSMSKFQAECPIIAKNKDVLNKDQKTVRYSYATLDSILSQTKEILGRSGLSYTIDTVNEDKAMIVTCKITHILGHSETSTFRVPIDMEGYMSTPQKYASASTFAKRYAFCNALGILTGEDDTDATDLRNDSLAQMVKEAQGKMSKVTSLDELKVMWASLPLEIKNEVTDLKEEMKKKLSKPAPKATQNAKSKATEAIGEEPLGVSDEELAAVAQIIDGKVVK